MDEPPSSPFPKKILPRDDRETAPIEEIVEAKRLGETTIDAIAKAQASSPHVVRRMVELEECLWALADLLSKLPQDIRNKFGADAAIEQAKTLLRKSMVMDHSSELDDRPAGPQNQSSDWNSFTLLDLPKRRRPPE
jgi:hypothetical protein